MHSRPALPIPPISPNDCDEVVETHAMLSVQSRTDEQRNPKKKHKHASYHKTKSTGDRIQERQALILTVCMLIMLAPAIAALVIASEHDNETSLCNDGTKYTIDLRAFLYCGGGVQLCYSGINLLIQCFTMITGRKALCVWYRNRSKCLGICVSVFILIWAAIGLQMWNNEMSIDCQTEAIGTMILIWSVYVYCLIASVCGVVCCVGVCAVKLFETQTSLPAFVGS
eukprot:286862_1